MSLHAYASRDSPPSHTLLDQNLDPRVSKLVYAGLEGSAAIFWVLYGKGGTVRVLGINYTV